MRRILVPLAILALMNLAAAPATIPTLDTPWSLLVQAGDLPATDSPRCTAMRYRDYPPYSKEWWDLAWDSEQQNTQQFQLLRRSRLLMEQNGGRSETPALGTPPYPWPPTDATVRAAVKPLNSLRNLANIVSDGAIFSHLNGNDTQALDRLMDEMSLARSIGQNNFLVSQLVRMGIEAQVSYTVEIIAPALRLSPQPDHAQTRRGARKLLKILLDERPTKKSLKACLELEGRGMMGIPNTTQPSTLPALLTSAEIQRDRSLLDHASELTSVPDMEETLARGKWVLDVKSIERVFITEFRVLANCRMAAIDLVAQLYRADHAGNWPANLQALVPAYLPAIPRDPFHADGAAIGYKIITHGWADGRDRPVVFSDAGADVPHLDSYPRLSWYASGKKPLRQYRDLTLPTEEK